jgi:hypothetical protein
VEISTKVIVGEYAQYPMTQHPSQIPLPFAISTMKAVLFFAMVVSTSAFTVPLRATTAATASCRPTVRLYSEPPQETKEGELDLDLEEMFTMFDAADKGEEFDKAIKKVKKDE